MIITVSIQEMEAAANAVANACNEWRDTLANLMKANDALMDVWVGDSRDKFLSGMEQRKAWYDQMAEVVDEMVENIKHNANTYVDLDNQLVSIINK